MTIDQPNDTRETLRKPEQADDIYGTATQMTRTEPMQHIKQEGESSSLSLSSKVEARPGLNVPPGVACALEEGVAYALWTLVAFHPRPQIASDLGRNVTCNFNPHRDRNQFPSGNEILAYGRRLESQPASTRCDLRIASPTRPFLQVI